MRNDLVSISKFLSLVLRHDPGAIGVALDAEGWIDVGELVVAANRNGKRLTIDLVREVVATNDKRRFALSDDGLRIRANQGHSLRTVDLGLKPIVPPELLYHGTVAKFLDSIRANGLQRKSRQHVHLSLDFETAQKVGMRRGQPVVLTIRAGAMAAAGHTFFRSENGVWLTDAVPREFIEFSEDE